uniref:Uncharacterized protein n=1 Tax=Amphora coffeiformis TaxID=265554 RepID=A0A7S3P899_9STRA|mmetsp:Transcript_20584/g.39066  ORF Transcript_20584/g.39066 Transcript_20584/m.39066 type:complete len:546 (+) Transcript_20584:207-1844(+)
MNMLRGRRRRCIRYSRDASIYASYDESDGSCYDYPNECDFGCSAVAAALAIYRDLRRTGAISGVITREVFQELQDRQLIRLGCTRQSKRILLCHIGRIPDPCVRQDLMELLAGHATTGDLRDVTLRVDSTDNPHLVSFLPDFVKAFPTRSLSKVTLQFIARGSERNGEKGWSFNSNFLLLWFSEYLNKFLQVPTSELIISFECDDSPAAAAMCVNLLRVLRSCGNKLYIGCKVRVLIYGGRFAHKLGIPASIAACCNVVDDLRLQSSSAFTLKSLAGLLRSTDLASSDSRLRDLSVFSIHHADDDIKMFCTALAECIYNPLSTLECLDFYSGVSFDSFVVSGCLGQSLVWASRASTAFNRGKRLRRLRFDGSGHPTRFWRKFCRDVLPHLRIHCLSIYNVTWSNKLFEGFKKGLKANHYVENLELVFLKGARVQYFRHDQVSLQRYLQRNQRMHQVWELVKMTHENKYDPLVALLDELTKLNHPKSQSIYPARALQEQEDDTTVAPLDFTYHLVRDALVTHMVSIRDHPAVLEIPDDRSTTQHYS